MITTDTSKFTVTRPPRPMLSRDADSVYWMSRYVERAEHIARILLVNSNMLIDVGELAPDMQEKQWQSVLTIMRAPPLPEKLDQPASPIPSETSLAQRVAQFMTFYPDNPSSLLTCISRARETARGARATISS